MSEAGMNQTEIAEFQQATKLVYWPKEELKELLKEGAYYDAAKDKFRLEPGFNIRYAMKKRLKEMNQEYAHLQEVGGSVNVLEFKALVVKYTHLFGIT